MIKIKKYTSSKRIAELKKDCNELTFDTPPADDFNNYKQYILEHISFAKVMKLFRLRPEECSTGKYTHRMVCPFKFHKLGRERTGSFRFNDTKKTFTCFGCTESGDILRFLQIYNGGYEQFHLERLASLAGLLKDGEMQLPDNYVPIDLEPAKETNHKILFDTGLLLRRHLLDMKDTSDYKKECEWADQALTKMDKYFELIDEENIEDAQKIYDNMNNTLKKRKSKRSS